MPKPRSHRRLTSRIAGIVGFCLLLWAGFYVGRAVAEQPHMAGALEHLRHAKGELERADADKGGHRVAAIQLVNQAIAEVEAGIAYAASH